MVITLEHGFGVSLPALERTFVAADLGDRSLLRSRRSLNRLRRVRRSAASWVSVHASGALDQDIAVMSLVNSAWPARHEGRLRRRGRTPSRLGVIPLVRGSARKQDLPEEFIFVEEGRALKTTLALGAAIAVLLGTATPVSAAADPRTSFTITQGTSYLKGSLTWHNRSVQVGARLRAASGCRTAVYTAWAGRRQIDRDTRRVCDRSAGHGFKLSANVAGGASRVVVELFSGLVRYDRMYCERSGCYKFVVLPK
ncbi:hypothetical protein ACFOY2_28205 [Nonomuraea purpurea]|uniref:Uncharacterized protein n=1 Tax=Nonomuraea purpurea TaxID=1849276 RepID=A0ABV8GE13_9ACTN